jgi:hypothetical protein
MKGCGLFPKTAGTQSPGDSDVTNRRRWERASVIGYDGPMVRDLVEPADVPLVPGVEHRVVVVNGVRLHVALPFRSASLPPWRSERAR